MNPILLQNAPVIAPDKCCTDVRELFRGNVRFCTSLGCTDITIIRSVPPPKKVQIVLEKEATAEMYKQFELILRLNVQSLPEHLDNVTICSLSAPS